jgi:ubiquinone/menaquinone biosynthesis C-methylase UbiE
MLDEILSYYENSDEASRFTSGSGLLEFVRTQEILLRNLPGTRLRILDVGGGPGNYAFWLAGLGHQVYLVDPSPKHVAQASLRGLAGVKLGDARALPCDDSVADAVLMMGPLYHLPQPSDRAQALREAYRALQPGGLIFAAAISRYASLFHSLVDGFFSDEAFWPILERDLAEGQHRNETRNLLYFTTAVFHTPEELGTEVTTAGFEHVEVVGIEGPGWLVKDLDGVWKDEQRKARLLELVRKVERSAPIAGCSLHLMAIGKKPA